MSKAAYWAARQHPPRPLDKLVLLAFADCPGGGTLDRHPSIAWLCEWTSCDRKTVIKSIASLEAAGLLIETGERSGRTRQVKVYRLPVETVPEVGPLAQTVPETAPLNSTVFPTEQSQKRDTEPPSEPRSSTKATPSPKKRARVGASKSGESLPELPPGTDPEAWTRFVEMRLALAKGSKPKPWTPGAQSAALKDLRKLAEAGHPPGTVLDQSTLNGWAGLFPIKDHRNEQSRSLGRPSADRGSARDAIASAFDRVSFD